MYAPVPARDVDAEKPPTGRLPADVTPLRYAVTLEIVPSRERFSGRVAIDLALDRPRQTLYLHALGLHATEVKVVLPDASARDGVLETLNKGGLSAVRLREPVGPGHVRLEIAYDAPFVEGLKGLYRAKAQGVHYAFTQFEAIAAREAFPCFDEPRFKTPFDVTLRVAKDDVAIANTREVASAPYGQDLREVRFQTTEKLPTYLLAFAVGPFDVVKAPDIAVSKDRDRPVPLRGIAVKGRGGDMAFALRETPATLAALERYFGIAYPYDKLDLIAVPDFAAGAMENPGAITFRDTYLLIKDDAPENQKRGFNHVNAHELAHQWFGNLVTMPWWDDIWLNEASATWMGERVIHELYPEYQAPLSSLSYTHYAMDVDSQKSARQIRQPIETDDDIENAFDAITYSKGGTVLSMFERYVGAETFREGLRVYMQRHRFGNATARDLISTLSEVAKRPLDAAFFSFLEQPGVPLVTSELDCKGKEPVLHTKQTRYFPLGIEAERAQSWQIPFCARFRVGTEIKEQCTLLTQASQDVPLEAGSCPTWLMPNAGAQGYYRWSLADAQVDQLLAAKAELSIAEQMSLAVNAYAALRSGSMSAERALTVIEQLGSMGNRSVLESALSSFGFARAALLSPSEWPAYRARLKAMVGPVFAKQGLFPAEGKVVDGENKLMRAMLVRSMAFSVEDPELRTQLGKLGRAQLGLAEEPRLAQLPRELVESALMVAVQDGGAPVFDKALEQLFASDDGMVRGRLLNAISSTKDPKLATRALELMLDARLRVNESLTPLSYQAGMVETREAAFAWLSEHLDALIARVSEHRGSRMITVFQGMCSDERAAALEQLFQARVDKLPGAPRELQLALESIRSCAAVRAAQASSAVAYFGKR